MKSATYRAPTYSAPTYSAPTYSDSAVFLVLVLVGIVGRFAFLEIPNFKPMAAVALFAGFYFARRRTALLVPLVVMIVSNLWLDSYRTWGEMLVVYAAMLFPVLLSRQLRGGGDERRGFSAYGFGTCLLAPSLVFFLASNFAVWVFSGFYPATLAGIVECYRQALPFYGYSLAGDLIFIPVVFGCYYAVRAGGPLLLTGARVASR